jgi:tetratricopeptide (TPR) repeat protein
MLRLTHAHAAGGGLPLSLRAMSHAPTAAFEQEIGSHLSRGDLAAAGAAAAACRAAWPEARAGWLFGSIIALMETDCATALAFIEERLRREPADVQCLLQKAECLLAQGEHAAAVAAADAAVAHSQQDPATLDALAEFFGHAGEHRRALGALELALTGPVTDPNQRATLLVRSATEHRVLGELELARKSYEAVLAIDTVAPQALKGLADLGRQTPERNWIAPMERALQLLPPASTHAAVVHFGLAKSYEDLGDFRRSWEHVTAANRVERAFIRYDSKTDTGLMQAMEEAFAAQEAPQSVPAASVAESPIFIVGLPRSGTTMVERILSSHPQVHAGGELTAIADTILTLTHRQGAAPADARGTALQIAALDPGTIAAEYLARTRPFRREGKRWTDKQLTNFLYVPLLLRAFPGARIVHLTRHPLASCYAIYRTQFNTQFNGSYPFAYDLMEIAEFYVAYRRLMAHWHRVLPGRILDVAYEDLVTELEPTVRRLLDHAGLPFDPACLQFHRNPAPVLTASSVQVRQPLYDSSLQRWKHYAEGLAPVRTRLEAAGIAIE